MNALLTVFESDDADRDAKHIAGAGPSCRCGGCVNAKAASNTVNAVLLRAGPMCEQLFASWEENGSTFPVCLGYRLAERAAALARPIGWVDNAAAMVQVVDMLVRRIE
jgi:hypothetical protein